MFLANFVICWTKFKNKRCNITPVQKLNPEFLQTYYVLAKVVLLLKYTYLKLTAQGGSEITLEPINYERFISQFWPEHPYGDLKWSKQKYV